MGDQSGTLLDVDLQQRLATLLTDHPLLQQALRQGDRVSPEAPQVMLLSRHTPGEGSCRLRVGVAYASLVSGCSCADDPTPLSPIPEYCELEVEISTCGEVREVRPARIR